jgi:uncharacterized membrane protein YhfC
MFWPLVFIALSALVCLFGPAALAVIFIKKRAAKLRAFLLGAAVFAVFQILMRLPLLSMMGNTAWFTLFKITQPVLYILLLAFTAGLFEEVGRFVGIRLFLKRDMLHWDNVFVFGLGHGGIEALFFVGVNYAVLFVQALSGQALAAVVNTPASYFLAAGVERVLAVAMHIGFTMLVFYAVRYRKPLFLLLAVAAHTVVDAVPFLLEIAGVHLGVWATEGVLAVLTALLVLVTIRFKPLLPREGLNNEGGTL